jgi:hexosaminidase
MSLPTLLPIPRSLSLTEGSWAVPDKKLILLDGPQPQALRLAADRLKAALRKHGGKEWELSASSAVPAAELGIALRIVPEFVPHAGGYRLCIGPGGVEIRAREAAGAYYGVCTLVQLLTQSDGDLPCLEISDWPDYPVRGVMLDISRDKVPTMDTLCGLVDRLSTWKVNQFQLYTEHTFAYRNHPEVWAEASPLTGEEILALDSFCRERFVELVPNQNSFGHMQRWLIHPRYAPLAEVSGDFETPWGVERGPFSLCPEDAGSLALVESLYDELLPHFTSRLFNIGCDETFDLGQGRSRQACQERGIGRVYLDFLLKLHRSVQRRGRRIQFWGDIIVQHPELVRELPVDAIALEWGYEAGHPFDERGLQYASAGIPFYACPGTSSWCSVAGRTDNALANLRNAAENGRKHGACGYLNTDWGDHGHWQALPVSYLGLAAGAAYSWHLESNRDLDVRRAVSLFAFEDASGEMGNLVYDLGNVYRAVGFEPPNASALFWILQWRLPAIQAFTSEGPGPFTRSLEAIETAMASLDREQMKDPEAALIREEFHQTAHLLRHACRRALLVLEQDGAKAKRLARELADDLDEIVPEYKRIWLARNRPGGLVDSVARLEAMAEDYPTAFE